MIFTRAFYLLIIYGNWNELNICIHIHPKRKEEEKQNNSYIIQLYNYIYHMNCIFTVIIGGGQILTIDHQFNHQIVLVINKRLIIKLQFSHGHVTKKTKWTTSAQLVMSLTINDHSRDHQQFGLFQRLYQKHEAVTWWMKNHFLGWFPIFDFNWN